MRKKIIITIVAILAVLLSAAYFNRVKVRSLLEEIGKGRLPKAASYGQAQKRVSFVNGSVETVDVIPLQADLQLPERAAAPPPAASIPDEINLDVPFMAQAPFGVWDAIHEDACEEASAIMAAHFVLKEPIPNAVYADREILKMVDWEKDNFGFWMDTDAEKTAEMAKAVYNLKDVEVKYDITIGDIKATVAAGYPVILPLYGRGLNPYFRAPGPLYHMLVVKGYTKDGKIITNDPGTKHGKDYVYDGQILFNAIHDWNGGDVLRGKKVMIVVKE